MLQEIRIQNLGVIDDAVLELHPGLNVVSGETGAGKTMVVSGLGLLLGARADAGLVRAGSRSAVVEGVVEVPPGHPAAQRAVEAGADAEDGLVLVRTVTAEGRSRAHVGGRSAPIGVLSEIGEHLVAVHGQADQWRLRQADQHRALLDQYAGDGVAEPLARYQSLFDEFEAIRAELARLREASRDRAREVEILQMGLEQIEELDPQPGEDAELRLEDERLSHAEGLRAAAGQARDLLAARRTSMPRSPARMSSPPWPTPPARCPCGNARPRPCAAGVRPSPGGPGLPRLRPRGRPEQLPDRHRPRPGQAGLGAAAPLRPRALMRKYGDSVTRCWPGDSSPPPGSTCCSTPMTPSPS